MKILVCIDDTDNLDSIGTGELLENMMAELAERRLVKEFGYVTRHQLFVCEQIKYTSHNSSMCCEAKTPYIEELLDFCRNYLESSCAEGSDPGLCVFNEKFEGDISALSDFGQKAQSMVLTKDDAWGIAGQYKDFLWLSEHGGTGDGIIGALAGIGLRLTGSDGRIKGKVYPKDNREYITCAEFCTMYEAGQVVDESDDRVLEPEEIVRFIRPTKYELVGSKVTAFAFKGETGYTMRIKKIKKNDRFCELFHKDYDEECFSDEEMSCYNCRYRRWTETGYDCMKGMLLK